MASLTPNASFRVTPACVCFNVYYSVFVVVFSNRFEACVFLLMSVLVGLGHVFVFVVLFSNQFGACDLLSVFSTVVGLRRLLLLSVLIGLRRVYVSLLCFLIGSCVVVAVLSNRFDAGMPLQTSRRDRGDQEVADAYLAHRGVDRE